LLEGGAAVLLELKDEGDVLFDAALDAAFVEGEEVEVLFLLFPDAALGEGDIDLLIAGDGVVWFVQTADDDGAFDGGGTLHTPTVVGDLLDEIDFHASHRGEGLVNALAVVFVRLLIGRRDDEDLAGQAMAIGIEGAFVARFFGGIQFRGIRFRGHTSKCFLASCARLDRPGGLSYE
jgi:hypothetical protein